MDHPVSSGAHRRVWSGGRRTTLPAGLRTFGSPRPGKSRQNWRRAAAIGVLATLAVPAFLLGAGLAGPGAGPRTRTPEAASGRAALDSNGDRPRLPSPASDSRRRSSGRRVTPTPGPGTPTPPVVGLTVQATVLDAIPKAGELIRIRVRWSDGEGRYVGLAEDWGDGTAASSAKAIRCTGTTGVRGGELNTAHRFATAGSYQVRLTVSTSGCGGRLESRAAVVTVPVGVASDAPASPASSLPTLPMDPSELATPLPSVQPSQAASTSTPVAPRDM